MTGPSVSCRDGAQRVVSKKERNMECKAVPAYAVQVRRVGDIVRPVDENTGCPFHLCALSHIGCLYLNPEGYVKKKCWRAIFDDVGEYDQILCRIDRPDFGPMG